MTCDHAAAQQLGSVAWCSRCGAVRTGEVADWCLPESAQLAQGYELAWSLELPRLTALPYHGRNLSVQVQRSRNGNYRAVLVDLGEFRGEGSGQSLAIDDLANELEHVAAEIRRESGGVEPDLDRLRAVYDAVLTWRRGELRTGLPADPRHMIATIDAAIIAEDTDRRASR